MVIILEDSLAGELKIETEHNDPDKKINPVITGDSKALFVQEVERSNGYYGHLITLENTSNLDIAIAVRQLPSFKVVKVDPSIDAKELPEDEVS